MGLLRQNPLEQFRPRAVKFSDVYKHGAKRQSVSSADKKIAAGTLKQAGYSSGQINKIISQDKVVPIAQMKKIAASLNKGGISGFGQSPQKLVDGYVRKEMIRRKNINQVMQERAKEAWAENLTGSAKTGGSGIKNSQKPKLNF